MRLSRLLPPLSAAVLCSLPAGPLAAQQRAGRPSAAEAQAILQSDPSLVAKLRDRIANSGLTPDQVRAKLRAEGYPEHMLDSYLTGGPAAGSAEVPGDSVFGAVAALNIPADSTGAIERQWLATHVAPDTTRASLAETPIDTTGLTIYGLSMFRQKTSMFDPTAAGAVDDNYVLGPGDQLVLILTGDVELAHSLEVTREGFVVIPQVGQLHVANLTLGQLDALLATRLARAFGSVGKGPGAGTRYSVSVSRLHQNQVFVVGEVATPGSYQVSSAGTALSALYAAGGPSTNGSMRRIEVRRAGRTVDAMDAYDYLLRGDASHDVRLKTGDIVFVPVHGPRVRVVGEVARPGTYEVKDQESLSDVLQSAGGFKAEASQRRVMVERILPPGQRAPDGRDRVVIDVPAERLASASGTPFHVEAGDVVRVFPVSDAVRDRIAVTGSVWAPGPQGFKPGMKLSDALRNAGGVRPDAMLDNVLVTRLMPDSTRRQLRATLTDRAGGVLNDLPLEENDEVQVFAGSQMREERYVAIGGAVRKPGRFPYRLGMTLRDLVLLAGGANESAYGQAEIARMPEPGSDRSVTARTFRVPVTTKDVPFVGTPTPGGAEGQTVRPTADAEVVLQPDDNVLILRRPDWTTPRSVMLFGEVQFPGRYTLTSREERVSDLLQRAGGLTPEAYAEGLVFYRAENRVGRVGIDLPRVMKDPKYRDNMLLTNGDSLFVPRYNATVDVRGAVNSPIAVAYQPGKKLDYYIRAAGGGSAKADLGRAYVTQASGKVESAKHRHLAPDDVPEPGAGSVVYVPQEDPTDKGPGYAAIAGATAQMLGALVAIIAISRR
jgi:protein involved in polysaccharide export with SLBB domain